MTMTLNARDGCVAYITKDGSTIREIMKGRHQSLAEATVAPSQTTTPHYHVKTEEIYYILSGQGLMMLEEDEREVMAGDAILIPPGKRHCIRNTGETDLTFLCCCAPGYRHEDTVLV